MRPRAVPPPTQRELGSAYAAGAQAARQDAEAGGEVPTEAAIRAAATVVYPQHPQLAGAWADGYMVAAGELAR